MDTQENSFEIEPVESRESLLSLTAKFGDNDPPLKRIFQIVLSQGCRTIVVEKNYEDAEYRSEYENFYKKIFKPPPDKTERLHFFSCDVKKQDIVKLSTFQDNYLGFCVLRPFIKQRVANAVISSIKESNKHKRLFILCLQKFPVEISVSENNTQKLTVEGFPFIQQDGHFGRCSHVSLTTINRFLKFGTGEKECVVNDIVRYSSKAVEIKSEVPEPGLSPYQISHTLQEMGYTPLIYCYSNTIKGRFSAERILYHYMESCIPVMLGVHTPLGFHALTVIGHSFEPDLWWPIAKVGYYGEKPSGGTHHCSASWAQNFIVNDDNLGPYMAIPKWFLTLIENTRELIIVVPLPRDVNVQGEDVEERSYRLAKDESALDYMSSLMEEEKLSSKTKDWCRTFLNHLVTGDLVLRTFLVDSKKFKDTHPSDVLRQFYQSIDMPPKIWLTEISIPELFSVLRLRVGEVITDSTRNVRFGDTFLTLHLPGILITRDPNTGKREYYSFPDDRPFCHVLRTAFS